MGAAWPHQETVDGEGLVKDITAATAVINIANPVRNHIDGTMGAR